MKDTEKRNRQLSTEAEKEKKKGESSGYSNEGGR